MSTPVSTFSPFTPFTPASSTHSTGGYFDRPATGNMGIPSPLGRRPDIRNSGGGSSSFLRVSRLHRPSDRLRQPSENGWRMASRMRDEAWSAWEQQLGNLPINTADSMNLLPDALLPSNRALFNRLARESPTDEPRAAVADGTKISCNPPRSPLELNIRQVAQGPSRSASSNGQPRLPKLEMHRRSFDPSLFPSRDRFHGRGNVSVN